MVEYLTLCVPEMMSAQSNQNCSVISSHPPPAHDRGPTQVRTTYTSPCELLCICRTALWGKCPPSTLESRWRYHTRLYHRCIVFSYSLFLNGSVSTTEGGLEGRSHVREYLIGVSQLPIPRRHDYVTHLLYTSALSVLPMMFPLNRMSEIRKRTSLECHTQMRYVIAVGQSRCNQDVCLSILGQSERRMC